MPRKTMKSKRSRRRTLRRKAKRGGNLAQTSAVDRQNMDFPSSAFAKNIGSPVNSADPFYFK